MKPERRLVRHIAIDADLCPEDALIATGTVLSSSWAIPGDDTIDARQSTGCDTLLDPFPQRVHVSKREQEDCHHDGIDLAR
jgi:hypothetical protein